MNAWIVSVAAAALLTPATVYAGEAGQVQGATVQAGQVQEAGAVAAPDAAPVNPNATPEARALLHEIDALSGHYTLTGQHNFPNHVSRWSDRVYDLTGKYPALFGGDFGFAGGDDKDSIEGRPSMIAEVERQYRNGSVIALCWHEVRPTDDEPVTFRDSVQGHLTNFEWDELLTPGTALNARWAAQVDVVAGYLQQLQAAGVPVLYRPFHEMNGNWFWWGGRPGPRGSAALYRMLYDRFVNYHHLNNLIWVWNVNSPGGNAGELASYDPGHEFADIYAIDIYGEFKQSYYDEMLQLAGNKPVALAEVGTMPTLEVMARQPRWAYFMMWSGSAEGSNSPELLQANFHAPNLLTRGDAALAAFAPSASAQGIRQTAEPVSRDSTREAKALLEKLYVGRGASTLSGQFYSTAAGAASDTPPSSAPGSAVASGAVTGSPAAVGDEVLAATGKEPAIYALDVGAVDAGLAVGTPAQPDMANIVSLVKHEHAAGAIVSLRWSAPIPTGGDGKNRALTSYEWSELLTSGSRLNSLWMGQVDVLAGMLKRLQDAHIAVLWDPYPESNGKLQWWAGHAGANGSAALYRMLFDRLVNHDAVKNLVWVWSVAPGGFGPSANGAYSDYFPGLLYTDALAIDLKQPQSRGRADVYLSAFAAGKAVGVSFGSIPDASLFATQTGWSWFLLPAGTGAEASQALKALYADPHVASRAAGTH